MTKKVKIKRKPTVSAARFDKAMKAIDELAYKVERLSAENEQLKAAAPAQTKAINNPVQITQGLEYDDRDIQQDSTSIIPGSGDAQIKYEEERIIPVEQSNPDKEALLAFNEELVTVKVHDTTNDRDVPLPEIQIDGRVQRFIRGKEQSVKRKYVLLLASLKKTTYKQEEIYTDNGKDKAMRNIPHTALLFPFDVVIDTPQGREYIYNIMRS